jgi:hypothetical protein
MSRRQAAGMDRRAVPGSFRGGAASLRWCAAFRFILAGVRRILEVFNNEAGANTVFIGGIAP